MKKILLFFSFILLFHLAFAQNISKAPATLGSSAIIENDVSIFFYAGTYGDTVVHIVWENYDPQNIKEVILESSNNGTDFSFLSEALINNLIDIHAYNYPTSINYYQQILASSEHGGNMRYLYNDIVKNIDIHNYTLWYRLKMITFSNQVYFSQIVNTKRKKLEVDTTGHIYDAYEEKHHRSEYLKSMEKGICQPVGTVPSGYTATDSSVTHYGTCCYWVETLFTATGPVETNCGGNSYAWCCDTTGIPTFTVCTSGYCSDSCCYHYCTQYPLCTCSGVGVPAIWQCCSSNILTLWVVTQSVTYPPITINATIVNETCANTSDGSISLTVNNATAPLTYTWMPSASGPNLTGLTSGTYSVTVTDSNGCSATATYTITHSVAVANAGANQTICRGNSATLVAAGGGTLSMGRRTHHFNLCCYTIVNYYI